MLGFIMTESALHLRSSDRNSVLLMQQVMAAQAAARAANLKSAAEMAAARAAEISKQLKASSSDTEDEKPNIESKTRSQSKSSQHQSPLSRSRSKSSPHQSQSSRSRSKSSPYQSPTSRSRSKSPPHQSPSSRSRSNLSPRQSPSSWSKSRSQSPIHYRRRPSVSRSPIRSKSHSRSPIRYRRHPSVSRSPIRSKSRSWSPIRYRRRPSVSRSPIRYRRDYSPRYRDYYSYQSRYRDYYRSGRGDRSYGYTHVRDYYRRSHRSRSRSRRRSPTRSRSPRRSRERRRRSRTPHSSRRSNRSSSRSPSPQYTREKAPQGRPVQEGESLRSSHRPTASMVERRSLSVSSRSMSSSPGRKDLSKSSSSSLKEGKGNFSKKPSSPLKENREKEMHLPARSLSVSDSASGSVSCDEGVPLNVPISKKASDVKSICLSKISQDDPSEEGKQVEAWYGNSRFDGKGKPSKTLSRGKESEIAPALDRGEEINAEGSSEDGFHANTSRGRAMSGASDEDVGRISSSSDEIGQENSVKMINVFKGTVESEDGGQSDDSIMDKNDGNSPQLIFEGPRLPGDEDYEDLWGGVGSMGRDDMNRKSIEEEGNSSRRWKKKHRRSPEWKVDSDSMDDTDGKERVSVERVVVDPSIEKGERKKRRHRSRSKDSKSHKEYAGCKRKVGSDSTDDIDGKERVSIEREGMNAIMEKDKRKKRRHRSRSKDSKKHKDYAGKRKAKHKKHRRKHKHEDTEWDRSEDDELRDEEVHKSHKKHKRWHKKEGSHERKDRNKRRHKHKAKSSPRV